MTILQEQERNFENEYSLTAEKRFRIIARRNKLLGLWLAQELLIDDPEAYAFEIIAADFEQPGDQDVVDKVMYDIQKCNAPISEQDIRKKLLHFFNIATQEMSFSPQSCETQ